MAPKRWPRAKAKAQAPARRVASGNARRGRRREAVRALNELCSEVGLGHAVLDAKAAEAAAVENLVRLLERRDLSGGRFDRLRTAAKAFLDNGGVFAAEVATEANTAPLVLRHKVLAPGFKLKSKAFMATYNGAVIVPETWQAFRKFVADAARALGAHAWAACLEKSLHSATPGLYQAWLDEPG